MTQEVINYDHLSCINAMKISPVNQTYTSNNLVQEHLEKDKLDNSMQSITNEKNKFYCGTCSVPSNSAAQFDVHLRGKQHIRKITKSISLGNSKIQNSFRIHLPAKFSCSICRVSCNSEKQMRVHLSGKNHLDKFRRTLNLSNTSVASSIPPKDNENNYVCNGVASNPNGLPFLYQTSYNSLTQCSMESAKNIADQSNNRAIFFCNLCGVSSNSEAQFTYHLSGKKHLSNAGKTSLEVENVNISISQN